MHDQGEPDGFKMMDNVVYSDTSGMADGRKRRKIKMGRQEEAWNLKATALI